MSEFSDRPFVAGHLVGLRAFSVDGLGRLTGPVYGGIFKPGENEAECKKREDLFSLSLRSIYDPYLPRKKRGPHTIKKPIYNDDDGRSLLSRALDPVPSVNLQFVTEQCDPSTCEQCAQERAERLANHKVAEQACTCGFYAYFDGGNDYKEYDRLSAIIKGYGICTVGTRGFRASRAELLAVVVPGKKFNPVRWQQIQRNYPDVPMFESKREALDAHPLTVPDFLTPDACDDFWTRTAS